MFLSFSRNYPTLSKRITRAFSLFASLLVGLSACFSRADDLEVSDPVIVPLSVRDLTPDQFDAMASLAAAAGVSTGNITNDVAAILDLLSSLTIPLGSSKAFETYPMSTARQTMGTTLGNALFESFNSTTGGTAANSLLKEIQRALWGVQGSPANHSASIAGLLEHLRDKPMTNDLSEVEDKLSTLILDVGLLQNPVSSINTSVAGVASLLSDWSADLTNPDHDAWMVELNGDSLDSIEGFFTDQTASLLTAISNAAESINSATGSNAHDLFEVISSIVDRIDDNFGGYDDHAQYMQNLVRQLLAGISSVAVSGSNMVDALEGMTFDIDLSPVVDAIETTDTHLERLRTGSLGYPAGNSQFLMLTNMLAVLVQIRNDLEVMDVDEFSQATNSLARAEAEENNSNAAITNSQNEVTDLANDDDTEPDWEHHKYTTNPLDQFSNALLEPLDQFEVLYTGAEDVSGETRITLFNGNFPVFGGSAAPSRSGRAVASAQVPLYISYGLTDTDTDVSSLMHTCNAIFGWVWDVCAAVLIGWLYKKFADWCAAPKILAG